MPQKPAAPFEIVGALLGAFDTNNRINEYLIRNLPGEVWRATPPGGKGRQIASMVAHVHNVRLMWLKSATGEVALPAKLEGDEFTKQAAIEALEASHKLVRGLLESAFNGNGRIKGFKPDVASFLGYLIAHDAHHRGQISMLARQLGYPLAQGAMFGMWEWGKR